jgi:hypothetical protein
MSAGASPTRQTSARSAWQPQKMAVQQLPADMQPRTPDQQHHALGRFSHHAQAASSAGSSRAGSSLSPTPVKTDSTTRPLFTAADFGFEAQASREDSVNQVDGTTAHALKAAGEGDDVAGRADSWLVSVPDPSQSPPGEADAHPTHASPSKSLVPHLSSPTPQTAKRANMPPMRATSMFFNGSGIQATQQSAALPQPSGPAPTASTWHPRPSTSTSYRTTDVATLFQTRKQAMAHRAASASPTPPPPSLPAGRPAKGMFVVCD